MQTIKAGVMEIADVFVINKSDREGADRVEREIRAMQTLAIRPDDWTPPIIKTVATEGTGISDLMKTITSYREYLEKKDLARRKKVSNWRERLIEMLRKALLDRMMHERLDSEHLNRYAREIAEHHRDPYSLVEELVNSFAAHAGEKHV